MRPLDPVTDSAARSVLKDLYRQMIILQTKVAQINATQLSVANAELRRGPSAARGSADEHKGGIFIEDLQSSSEGDKVWFSVQGSGGSWDWMFMGQSP